MLGRQLKYLFALLLLPLFALPCIAVEVAVNGEFVEYDIGVTGLPILENGTILLPLYKTCEALGAKVVQDNPYGTAIVSLGGVSVSCNTGDNEVVRNGTALPTDYGLIWRGGPLYVDARFFEFLDADVYTGKDSVIITAPSKTSAEYRLDLYASLPDTDGVKRFGVKYEPKSGIYLGSDLSRKQGAEPITDICGYKIRAYRLSASDFSELSEAAAVIHETASDAELFYLVIEERTDGFGGVIENREVYVEMAKRLERTGANLVVGFGQNPNCADTLYGDIDGYIERYRAFSSIIREYAPSAATVFSVCGACGDFAEYYPGDVYVDYVGVSACDRCRASNPMPPLCLPDEAMSLYSYKKPMMITSPLYGYVEAYAEKCGRNTDEALLDLYSALPIKHPQIKAAFLFEEPSVEAERLSLAGCENAVRAGLGASGRFSEDADGAIPILCNGSSLPPRSVRLFAIADNLPDNRHRVMYSINGGELTSLEGSLRSGAVDFSDYAGSEITLRAVLLTPDGDVLSEKSIALSVSEEKRNNQAIYRLLAYAFAVIVSVIGIIVVSRKINRICGK